MNIYDIVIDSILQRAEIVSNFRITRPTQEVKLVEKSYLLNLIINNYDNVDVYSEKIYSNLIKDDGKFKINIIDSYATQHAQQNYLTTVQVTPITLIEKITDKTIYMSVEMKNGIMYDPINHILSITMNNSVGQIDIHHLINKFDLALSHIINLTTNSPLKVDKSTLETIDISKEDKLREIHNLISRNDIKNFTQAIKVNNFENRRKLHLLNKQEKEQRIKTLELEIKNIESEIRRLEEDRIFQSIGQQEEELVALLSRSKYIKRYSVYKHNNTINLSVLTNPLPWDKIDYPRLEKAFPNIWTRTGQKRFKEALRDVIDKKATLYFGQYEIKLTIAINPNNNESSNLSYNLIPLGPYSNPHERISCYGGYGNYIRDALKDKNLPALILTLLEFLRHITIGDGGSSDLPERCYIENEKGEKIYG